MWAASLPTQPKGLRVSSAAVLQGPANLSFQSLPDLRAVYNLSPSIQIHPYYLFTNQRPYLLQAAGCSRSRSCPDPASSFPGCRAGCGSCKGVSLSPPCFTAGRAEDRGLGAPESREASKPCFLLGQGGTYKQCHHAVGPRGAPVPYPFIDT